ncbi:MAG TPA: hypothetical protein VH596_06060 [Terriglobales bacterium]
MENKNPVTPIWVLAFCVAGVVILGLSSLIEDHKFYKPIVESIGDGVLLLGLIDLFLQARVLSWLTRPSEMRTLVDNVKNWIAGAQKVNEQFEKLQQKNALERIEEQNKQILSELKALRISASKSAP